MPQAISQKIAGLTVARFEVAAGLSLPNSRTTAENFEHLGLHWRNNSVIADGSVLPDPQRGRWSRWNITGRVIVRRDRDKIQRTYGWDAPNFGDPDKGSHFVSQTRWVWPRQLIYGQHLALVVSVSQQGGDIALSVRVDHPFDRDGYSDRDLIFCLSLLQENLGAVDVVEAGGSPTAWRRQIRINWDILPPGSRSEQLRGLRQLIGDRPEVERTVILERAAVMFDLNPQNILVGTSGFARYLGYQFEEDLVAFENLRPGNAIYVMFEDWQTLSRRSRTELLSEVDNGFVRITHRDGWQSRVNGLIRANRRLP